MEQEPRKGPSAGMAERWRVTVIKFRTKSLSVIAHVRILNCNTSTVQTLQLLSCPCIHESGTTACVDLGTEGTKRYMMYLRGGR